MEGKREIICMQDGQAIKIISETHHIKVEKWEIKEDVCWTKGNLSLTEVAYTAETLETLIAIKKLNK